MQEAATIPEADSVVHQYIRLKPCCATYLNTGFKVKQLPSHAGVRTNVVLVGCCTRSSTPTHCQLTQIMMTLEDGERGAVETMF